VAHANHRGRIPTSLAPQGNVAEEGLAVRALPPQQQRPRHIGNASAFWARRSQVRVALTLRLTHCRDAPLGIDFHRARDHWPKPIPFARCLGGGASVALVPLKGLDRTVKGVEGGSGERGVSGVTHVPNWTGYCRLPFFTERHGPGCVPNPPFATTGTVPFSWGGAMTKMLFLIALMAPILLTALGALIHGPDHASTTEQD
jgi:hypothetical protein